MNFTKMHGLGNDFIMIENIDNNITCERELSLKLCDRHFGIGADGLILIEKSDTADIKMKIINSDGSIAEMCGNGIRCFAMYVYDKAIVKSENIRIETLAGIMKVKLNTENHQVKCINVDMGKPSFEKNAIPFISDKDNRYYKINTNGIEYFASTLLMGVPHTIVYTDSLNKEEVISNGKLIENMDIFPHGTNVNFVKVSDRKNIQVRTWERGAGYTLACGTGTCASAVSCIINGKTDNIVYAALAGGNLKVEYNGENVFMEGPADYICEGRIL